jgi:hypothetical protein
MSAGRGQNVVRERNLNRFGLGCSTLLAIFLILVGFYNVSLYRRAVRSLHWPSVPATLTEWEIQVWKTNRGNEKRFVRCAYTYRVGDTVYIGTKLRISPDGNGLGYAKEYAAALDSRYHQGGGYEIRYNPANPEESVLEPGTDSWQRADYSLMFIVLLGIVFAGVAVWGLRYPRLKHAR